MGTVNLPAGLVIQSDGSVGMLGSPAPIRLNTVTRNEI